MFIHKQQCLSALLLLLHIIISSGNVLTTLIESLFYIKNFPRLNHHVLDVLLQLLASHTCPLVSVEEDTTEVVVQHLRPHAVSREKKRLGDTIVKRVQCETFKQEKIEV
jgi:hypothetical protein